MTTEHAAPTPLEARGRAAGAHFRTVRTGAPPLGLDAVVSPDLRVPTPSLHDVPQDPTAALADELARAYEELGEADDELRVQRAELERLGHQRESLNSVLPLPVVTTDRVGRIRAANGAAGRRLGLSPLVLARKPLLAFIDVADRRAVRSVLESVADEPSRLEVRLAPRAGQPEPVQVLAVAQGLDEVDWTVVGTAGDALEADAPALALGLAELCRLPVGTTDRWRLLSAIATIARDSIGTVDAASALLGVPDEPTATGSSSNLAAAMDGLQMRACEGPTLDAQTASGAVVSDDLTEDQRWPALAALAAGCDVRSALSLPLWADGERVGSLTCYARAAGAFGSARRVRAELVGSAVGSVIAAAFQHARLRDLAENLDRALVSRQEIDEAKGIVMGQRRCGPDDAFRFLAAVSQRENVKLRVLAHRIVTQAAGLDE